MDWDQIERRWAAMTQRVRGDQPVGEAAATPRSTRRKADVDKTPLPRPDQTVNGVASQRNVMSTE